MLFIDVKLPHVHRKIILEFSGRVLGVTGASGAGKTTLLEILAGFTVPEQGRVIFDGEIWCDTGQHVIEPPWKRRAVMVPQEVLLFPHVTVEKNISFAGGRDTQKLMSMLAIDHLKDSMPDRLSGGEQQRVAIARALNASPRLLLLDEPYSALNRSLRQHVASFVHEWTLERGIPYVLVSHDLALVESVSDVVLDIDALE